jgi:hypothetical protein
MSAPELHAKITPTGRYFVVHIGTAQIRVSDMRQAKNIVDGAQLAYRMAARDTRKHIQAAIGLDT